MKNQIEEIKKHLKEGYSLVDSAEHGTSQYYYISSPMGVELKARVSDHETMTGRSASHVNILSDRFLHLDFDFEITYDDDDCEIELTGEIVGIQLSSYLGVNIDESQIEEFCESSVKLDNMELQWKDQEAIIGVYIANEIMKVNNVSLTY